MRSYLFTACTTFVLATLASRLYGVQTTPVPPVTGAASEVTRATLDNGLRVVIIRDPLAPVVTVEDNYLAGGNDAPPDFPGTAHAQEHMTFRGCRDLSADQISTIYAQLGGYANAETRQTDTKYFVTLPAQDLDVELRLDAACMAGVKDDQADWVQERGAISQEVSRDIGSPFYKLEIRLNQDLLAGTPYEQQSVGTIESFDKTTAAELKKFYDKWYAPNNAILVIAGDVDPVATLEKIKQYYGGIPRKDVPAHTPIHLQPVKKDTFTLDSNLPYPLTTVAYRMPGFADPDFPAVRVLIDVLGSQRAAIYALGPQGKALGAGFQAFETHSEATVAFAYGAIAPGTDPEPLATELQKIVTDYATSGVPADLVEASKRSWVASAEFGRNSISNLADLWSETVAEEHRQSPDEEVQAIQRVTVEDVNRVAKKYLLNVNPVIGNLKPMPSGKAVDSKGFGGSEQTVSAPSKPVPLPNWAEAAVKSLALPKPDVHASDVTLPNGIRLVVQTEKTSPTVTLTGSIKTQSELQMPKGKDGVDDIVQGLFSYGTKTLDRIALQKALDDIAASESAGPSFSLKVLKNNFERGVQLLADNELHPAFPADAFKIVQQQTAEATGGELETPGYRTSRAVLRALLPPADPLQREQTPNTVMAVTYDDVQKFYASVFRPDLTTIVVIGDITPEEARGVIEKNFGEWKASGPKPDVVLPPVPMNKPSAINVPDPSRVQDTVHLSEQVEMNRFTPDYYALQLGNHVLGGGFFATRLERVVRHDAGYVYSIDNQLSANETRTQFDVDYGCDPKNVGKARALVEREIRSMRQYNVSPEELQQAKALMLRQLQLRDASEDAIAGSILARARIGLPLNESFISAKRYFDTNADQIRTAFSKYIDPANLVQIVRGPAPQ